jgi:hypothetical protein
MVITLLRIIDLILSENKRFRPSKASKLKTKCKPTSLLPNKQQKQTNKQNTKQKNNREINVASPGMSPLFLSQKMAAKEPEKKIPSTAAKAMTRSAKVAFSALIQDNAQSAFFLTAE